MTQASLKFYGALWCGDCRRSKRFLDKHDIPYEFIDTDQNAEAAAIARSYNRGRLSIPTIVFPDGSFVIEPSDRELAQKLALES
jgi:glutaredoxin